MSQPPRGAPGLAGLGEYELIPMSLCVHCRGRVADLCHVVDP